MTIFSDLASICSAVQSVPGAIGFRPQQVNLKRSSFTGVRPGVGTVSSTSTTLCSFAPNVEIMNPKPFDIPGSVREGDIQIGPIPTSVLPSVLTPSVGQSVTITITNSEQGRLDGEYEVVRWDVKHGSWYVHARHVSR
jgi:hypothetical protein